MNYFTVERNGQYREFACLGNYDTGEVEFAHYLDMNYEEMKNSSDLEDFVCAVMDATSEVGGDQVAITLVDEDGWFIWGILIGYVDNELRYSLVDWRKDGKKYRYED